MSGKDESYIDAASRLWNDAKQEHPKSTAAASFVPGVGQAVSALELNDAANRGDKRDMALAAAGMVPAVKLIATGAKAVRAGQAVKGSVQVAAGALPAASRAGAGMKFERWPDAGNGVNDYADEWNAR